MQSLNELYRERIGFPRNEQIYFEQLDRVLELAAQKIPFENLCIVERRIEPVTRESLVRKICVRGEGGLCYELNPMLYYFLLDNGFNVRLTRGVVYNAEAGRFGTTGRTHVAILLEHEGQTYLLDTGFGGNLPLKPVPLAGEAVTSANGSFRVAKKSTEHGDYVFEMKLKHKDEDWRMGYAFHSGRWVTDTSELDEVQSIIVNNPSSSFNKHRLITKLNDRGSVTLTDHSLTLWIDGEMSKEELEPGMFRRYLEQYFGKDA